MSFPIVFPITSKLQITTPDDGELILDVTVDEHGHVTIDLGQRMRARYVPDVQRQLAEHFGKQPGEISWIYDDCMCEAPQAA